MKNGKPAPGGKGGDWLAQRRMLSLSVVDTDRFLSLPVSAQNLYFHFGMRADDDGFVSAPRKSWHLSRARRMILPEQLSLGGVKP